MRYSHRLISATSHVGRCSKIDGRWIAAGAVAAFVATIYILGMRTDFVSVWKWVGVPHLSPPFGDSRVITAGLEIHRSGGDPLVSNSLDPWGRPMNYPRVWLGLSRLGLGPKHTPAIGIVLAAGFYTAMFFLVGRITVAEGFIYAGLLCSPPAMLAVERGNNDLFLFALLVVAALLFDQKAGIYCSYALITVASILKLYPVCGFVVGLRERRRHGLALLCLGLIGFAVYAYCIRSDIATIARTTMQLPEISYGRRVLFQELVRLRYRIPIELCSRIAVVASILLAVIASYAVKRLRVSSRAGTMMAIGAAIYAGTFVATLNNFNYRLIFLLFLLPQLLEWGKRHDGYRWLGGLCILVITGAMLFASCTPLALFILKEILNWTVFAICLFVLICLSTDAKSALMGGSIK